MKVAIVHYHLKPGGVTRVIDNAIKSLSVHSVKNIVLTGDLPSDDFSHECTVIPRLNYLDSCDVSEAEDLVTDMLQAAEQALGGLPDVWHIHNHCLGKNALYSEAVYLLAKKYPVLLQIHDFAEDGRPGNYRYLRQFLPEMNHLYPKGEHVYYGLLNGRDIGLLAASGIDRDRLVFLPNPVSVNTPVSRDDNKLLQTYKNRLILYPTRSIRRKNMGEFLLWSALAKDEFVFANSLAPKNPSAIPIYDDWKMFSKEQDISVEWELGETSGCKFADIMDAARAIITTSVAEGFGLAFLEPWLFNKSLVGRDLPEITGDFKEKRVNLNSLYPSLLIPVECLGEERIRQKMADALIRYYDDYDWEKPSNDTIECAYNAACHEKMIDFGRIDEELQKSAILCALNDNKISEKNNFKQHIRHAEEISISNNQKVINSVYSFNLSTSW